MATSTTKKAIVRRFEKEPLSGYINPHSFLQLEGIELLSAEGNVMLAPYHEVKSVAFVREFEGGSEPEHRTFLTRPKMAGLWMSFRFRDGEVMEGVMPNNLLPSEQHGFMVTPPEPYGNQQRFFIPRAALASAEVLGVVGSPLRRRKPKPAAKEQIGLFDE